jgi:hypothetical protein
MRSGHAPALPGQPDTQSATAADPSTRPGRAQAAREVAASFYGGTDNGSTKSWSWPKSEETRWASIAVEADIEAGNDASKLKAGEAARFRG